MCFRGLLLHKHLLECHLECHHKHHPCLTLHAHLPCLSLYIPRLLHAFSQTSLPMPYPSHPAGQAQHYSLPGTSTGPFTPYQQRHHYACHTHRILQDRHSTTVSLALAQAHSLRTNRDIITHAIPIASCRTGTALQSPWH